MGALANEVLEGLDKLQVAGDWDEAKVEVQHSSFRTFTPIPRLGYSLVHRACAVTPSRPHIFLKGHNLLSRQRGYSLCT